MRYQSCGSKQQKKSRAPRHRCCPRCCQHSTAHCRLSATRSIVCVDAITLAGATSIGCANKKALGRSRQGGDVIRKRQQRAKQESRFGSGTCHTAAGSPTSRPYLVVVPRIPRRNTTVVFRTLIPTPHPPRPAPPCVR